MIGKIVNFLRKAMDSKYSDREVQKIKEKSNGIEELKKGTARLVQTRKRLVKSVDYDLVIYKQTRSNHHGN